MGAEHHYTRTSEVWRVEREVDLRRLGGVLWKRRPLIAILTIVAAVAAGAFGMMTSRLYESQVLLRLSDQAAHSELRARERELTLELLALDPPELLDAPSGPDLVAPRMTPLVSAAAVLGLLAGSALALLIDYLTVPPVGLPQPAPAVSRPSAPES